MAIFRPVIDHLIAIIYFHHRRLYVVIQILRNGSLICTITSSITLKATSLFIITKILRIINCFTLLLQLYDFWTLYFPAYIFTYYFTIFWVLFCCLTSSSSSSFFQILRRKLDIFTLRKWGSCLPPEGIPAFTVFPFGMALNDVEIILFWLLLK